MSKLRVKNFGPITAGYDVNDGFIDINKYTLFIGDQGTGKSTVSKLISICSWLEKTFFRGDYDLKTFEEDVLAMIPSFDWVSNYGNPEIVLKELTEAGMHCTIQIWTSNPWQVEKYKSQLAKKVQKLLYED